MARRARSRAAARRGPRARRTRLPAGWPRSKPSAGKGTETHGARVVSLTAARRRAVERNRPRRPQGPVTPPATIDFHLNACVACARAGASVIMDYWGRRGAYPIQEKGRNDFVTIVDRRAEEAIVTLIRDRFPDHSILAEESLPSEGASGYRWYIDPLDGTTNFIHGYPLFSVSVGLADPQGLRAARRVGGGGARPRGRWRGGAAGGAGGGAGPPPPGGAGPPKRAATSPPPP